MQFITSFLIIMMALASAASAYRLSVWEEADFQGRERVYTTAGTKRIGFGCRSYIWDSPGHDGCCVKFCRGSTSVGYWCPGRRQPSSSAVFDKVVLGCGTAVLNC